MYPWPDLNFDMKEGFQTDFLTWESNQLTQNCGLSHLFVVPVSWQLTSDCFSQEWREGSQGDQGMWSQA